MPSFKLSGIKSQEVKSGFESYDGEVPLKKGFYRAELKKLKFKQFSKGSKGFYIVVEMAAAKGDPKDHAKYNGFPMFIQNIITETADGSPLKEGSIGNLSNFLDALGVGDEPNVVVAPGEIEDGVDVLKIGGKNPIGAFVNIDLGTEMYNEELRPTSNGIYKVKAEVGSKMSKPAFVAAEEEDEDEDLMAEEEAEETEEGAEEDEEFNARSAELEGLGIPALKKIAKDLKVTLGGKKDEIIGRILDAEFSAAALEEDDEAEEDEEEDGSSDVEIDDEEEEDDEAEEEDDEEDDGSADRRTELDGLDRADLKTILKDVNAEFRVLKRNTDDELRDAIITAEFGDTETPF